jgi:hypothetical protein
MSISPDLATSIRAVTWKNADRIFRLMGQACAWAKHLPKSKIGIDGAGSRIRTDDLLITNQLLYQLSYVGVYLGKPPRGAIPKIEQVYTTIPAAVPKQISPTNTTDRSAASRSFTVAVPVRSMAP